MEAMTRRRVLVCLLAGIACAEVFGLAIGWPLADHLYDPGVEKSTVLVCVLLGPATASAISGIAALADKRRPLVSSFVGSTLGFLAGALTVPLTVTSFHIVFMVFQAADIDIRHPPLLFLLVFYGIAGVINAVFLLLLVEWAFKVWRRKRPSVQTNSAREAELP
jgi:hypothetical protein